jgi:hypothetical protein
VPITVHDHVHLGCAGSPRLSVRAKNGSPAYSGIVAHCQKIW